jgi:hypothetical protein
MPEIKDLWESMKEDFFLEIENDHSPSAISLEKERRNRPNPKRISSRMNG